MSTLGGAGNGGHPSPSLITSRVRKSAGVCVSSVITSWQDVDPGLLSLLACVSCLTWHSNHFSTLLVSGVVDLED